MSSGVEFIEIRRVASDKEKVNISGKPEVIPIRKIDSFRAWHKGKNDVNIQGNMTIIIVCEDEKEKKEVDEILDENKGDKRKKVKTILIEEDYKDFLARLSSAVPVRMLKDYYAGKVIRYNDKQQTP
jgi:hypothetical protein